MQGDTSKCMRIEDWEPIGILVIGLMAGERAELLSSFISLNGLLQRILQLDVLSELQTMRAWA